MEWTETAGFPLTGAYRTPTKSPNITGGENVVVLARYTVTNKPLDVRVAHHFAVRGALIVRFERFVDTPKVRDTMNGR